MFEALPAVRSDEREPMAPAFPRDRPRGKSPSWPNSTPPRAFSGRPSPGETSGPAAGAGTRFVSPPTTARAPWPTAAGACPRRGARPCVSVRRGRKVPLVPRRLLRVRRAGLSELRPGRGQVRGLRRREETLNRWGTKIGRLRQPQRIFNSKPRSKKRSQWVEDWPVIRICHYNWEQYS